MKRKREQAPVSIVAWSWEHDWGDETVKQGQTQAYIRKSWDHMGCVCFDRGYRTHYQLETQPVNHKQDIGGEELAGVL